MQFVKKNMWTVLAMALFISVAMVSDAAAASDIMQQIREKLGNLFTSVRGITFSLGGFGLVAVAFLAIFGKLQWKWFAGLAVGLAVLAAANAVVKYSSGDMEGIGNRVSDTFGSAGGY